MRAVAACLLAVPLHVSRAQPRMASSYRADGVRIQHDPHAPDMARKYGRPGETDREGFDPYADTVGAGIYGGSVKRDASGRVLIGTQYQGHNPRPGPVYDGGGYSPMTRALHAGREAVEQLLDEQPELVHEISTGGATPLHMCGMSQRAQHLTELLIRRGANIEAVDTYSYRPLHRMASNNLAVGAAALLAAGADADAPSEKRGGGTALEIAMQAHAFDVVRLLRQHASAKGRDPAP